MGRPREHDLDTLLDHARQVWIEQGVTALTIRALSSTSAVSNGAIYHAFGTRAGLLAAVWAREASGFLDHLRDRVAHSRTTSDDPVEALVAAGLAPATYAADHPSAARLLLATDLDDLFAPELDEAQQAALSRLRDELGATLVDLADLVWERHDRPATTLVRYCVVDLPGCLLLGTQDVTDPLARLALENAIRGVAATPLPSPTAHVR